MNNLPLLDGCFLFDNSSLEQFQNCPHEYYISHIRRRILNADRAGMNFGSCCHLGEKLRYELYGNNPCGDITPIHAAFAEHFDKHPEPVGDYRNLGMAQEWLRAYNEVYGREPFEIIKLKDGRPFVEMSFMTPFGVISFNGDDKIPIINKASAFFNQPINDIAFWIEFQKKQGNIPIFFTGRIDLGISDQSGKWVMDAKHVFMFGKNFTAEMQASNQMRGYCWQFQKFYGELPKGYIINATRVRPPVKGAEFDSSLLFRTSGKDPDFLRIPQHISQTDLDEWEQNTLHLLEELFFNYNRGVFGKHKKSCVGKYGPCQFYELCNSVEPGTREAYLMSNSFCDNNWSPLNNPKTKE